MSKKYKSYICETCGKEFEEYYFKRFCCNDCRIFYKYGDLTGKKFNRLSVIKLVTKDGRRRWLCKCDCGNETIVATDNLNNGKTKSCGCLVKEKIASANLLPIGEASFNRCYRAYKKGAKERNLEFNLTQDQFKELTSSNCYYCGATPSKIWKQCKCNGYYIYNGIDRVDNIRGYNLDNCVSCCTKCNIMKKAYTQEDFLNHIKKIFNNLNLN